MATSNIKKVGAFVEVTPLKNGNIFVSWGYDILKKQEENSVFSCYIPSFDIYFAASDEEMIEKKSNAMTKSFFDNFFIYNEKHPLKYMALELAKKGFKENMMTMKSLVKDNIAVNANFKSLGIKPKDFEDAEKTHKVSNMEMAF